MKGFSLLMLWLTMLIGNVWANDEAIAFELMYYYYAYKMSWQAGTTKSLAVGCTPKSLPTDTESVDTNTANAAANAAITTARALQGLQEMCAFDEFVKFVMNDEWTSKYQPNPTTDHVIDPDLDAAAKINAVNVNSARYNLKALSTKFSAKKPIQFVLDTITSLIQDARKTGDVPPAILDKAKQMIGIVQHYRNKYIFSQKSKDFDTSLKALIPYKATKQITIPDGSGPDKAGTTYIDLDSDQILQNIDAAIAAGNLQNGDPRAKYTKWVQNYGTKKSFTYQFVKNHMAVIRKLKEVVDHLAISTETLATLTECDAE